MNEQQHDRAPSRPITAGDHVELNGWTGPLFVADVHPARGTATLIGAAGVRATAKLADVQPVRGRAA